jgi:hypothetical protein
MAMLKIRALNDNTKGFRFDVIGIKGLYRKRSFKTRYELNIGHGDTFSDIHFGKRSLYIEQIAPLRKLFAFAGNK